MTIRTPPVNSISPGLYRDTNTKVTLRIGKIEDDIQGGVNLDGNTIPIYNRRSVSFNINSSTVGGKEFPIIQGGIKLMYIKVQPNTTEEIADIPIISPGGDVVVPFNDLKQTLAELLNVIDQDFPF